MNELKFNSQVCTSVEQSNRLLDMGLKPETADMHHFKQSGEFSAHLGFFIDTYKNISNWYQPAWSLHRLIELCNKTKFGMTISIYNDEVAVDGDLFEVFDNTYDNLISIIE